MGRCFQALVGVSQLVALVLISGACGRNDSASPWDASRTVLDTVPGFFSDSAVPLAQGDFRIVSDADGDPPSDFVIWTDVDPPFVRTSDGAAFIEKGDGPGEARSVKSVSVVDSLILAVLHRRLSWFKRDGEFINSIRTDFRVDDATQGCRPGTWVLYGEGTTLTNDSVAWLHEFDPATAEIRPLLRDRPSPFAFQSRDVRLRRIGNRVRYDHSHGDEPGLYEFDCASRLATRMAPTPLVPDYFRLDNDPVPRQGTTIRRVSLSSGRVGAIRRLDLPEPVYSGSRSHIISVDSMYLQSELLRYGPDGWETIVLPTFLKVSGQVGDESIVITSDDVDPILYRVPLQTFADGVATIWAGDAS